MKPLPAQTNDSELILFIDNWVKLLQQEDYQRAYEYTEHNAEMNWTAEWLCKVIKSYDEAKAEQRVTFDGQSEDNRMQCKVVERCFARQDGYMGYIWYDLYIDGQLSDLTATFDLYCLEDGIHVCLNDIHVM